MNGDAGSAHLMTETVYAKKYESVSLFGNLFCKILNLVNEVSSDLNAISSERALSFSSN
jgi:hypothetical protein